MAISVTEFSYTEGFLAEVQGLDQDTLTALKAALELLQKNPRANSLRLHSLKGMPKPTVYKIDIFPNKSKQVTFELVGTVAHLKRVATHKEIDRRPR